MIAVGGNPGMPQKGGSSSAGVARDQGPRRLRDLFFPANRHLVGHVSCRLAETENFDNTRTELPPEASVEPRKGTIATIRHPVCGLFRASRHAVRARPLT
jgi:hypothetical protein